MKETFSEEMKAMLYGDEAECLDELANLSIAMTGQTINCEEPKLKIEIEGDEGIKHDKTELSLLDIFKETEVVEKENDREENVIKRTDKNGSVLRLINYSEIQVHGLRVVNALHKCHFP